ncbi:helix-turn-helix domain-containing protein [Enterobacter hormaechei]|uniref:helix-turn-helix domain-containing protein n=1 Tax=Enterobacter hormaechei TaxID=158836 RepID=UPI003369D689
MIERDVLIVPLLKMLSPKAEMNILSLKEDKFKLSPEVDILKIPAMGDKMNVTSPKILAQAVRNARKQRELTQREAAESISIKQSTLSEFENHPEGARLNTLFKLLAALDLKLQVVSRRGENRSSDSWDQEW